VYTQCTSKRKSSKGKKVDFFLENTEKTIFIFEIKLPERFSSRESKTVTSKSLGRNFLGESCCLEEKQTIGS